MVYSEEFRLECFVWIRAMRGPKFVRRLRQLVDRHGPDRSLELLTHPTMSDELVECHAAAIEHVANQLAAITSLPTRYKSADRWMVAKD